MKIPSSCVKNCKVSMDTSVYIKNAQSKQLNFEHGFRPIYHFSWAVGLWPFSIRHNSRGTIQNARISRLDGVWFLISMCFHLSAIFYCYKNMVDLEDSNKTILTFSILYNLFQIKSLLIGAVGIILDMVNRHRLVNILGKFITFDNEVGHSIYNLCSVVF